MDKLDIKFIRSKFPSLQNNWTFFDNAGGSQTAEHVGKNIVDYLYSNNVQLGASYEISQNAQDKLLQSQKRWAEAINADNAEELIFGPSTTALLQNLSRSLSQTYSPSDEVIVTNSDHEANIGPWIEMKKNGIIVKFWNVNPESLYFELSDLDKLITKRTKLVAFTHVSNILGTINPISEITRFVHKRGAKVCVDGVAYAPHRLIDVKKWDVDYYVFSLYKVYGPHYSLLYGKKELLLELPSINHFFIEKNDIPYKFQPGNLNYELTVGCEGVLDYFDDVYNNHYNKPTTNQFERISKVFDLIELQEEELSKRLIEYLTSKQNINIIGEQSFEKSVRVPTVSFTVDNRKSSSIPLLVDPYNIGIRWGDFYARRLIEDLELANNDGIVRVSMVHYNTAEEVDRLINVFEKIL